MTDLITEIKQIIEDEAEKNAKEYYINHPSVYRAATNICAVDNFKACAELLLPVLELAISQRNNYLSQKVYSDVQFEAYKKELNQELINILKEGKHND